MSESLRISKPIGLLLGLLLIVPLIAFSIVQLNGPEIRKSAFDNLNAVADLKVTEIENWLFERKMDLEFLSAAEEFDLHAERLVLTGDADSRVFVARRLEAYSKSRFYHSAVLLNASGQVVAAAGESNDVSAPVTQQLLQDALKSGQIEHGELYRDANTGHVHLDYLLPLRRSGGRQPVAAVLLHAPADNFLFPHIQTWPSPSLSAETLLVRREGNDLLFLNKLRHSHGSALSLRLPLDVAIRPGAAAILAGKAETLESVDYRDVAVFAAIRPIAGTPWFLVAKVDRDEIMAPLKELIYWVSLLAFAAIFAVSIVFWRLWRQTRLNQQLELAAQAMAIQQQSDAKFRRLHESMMDAYVMKDMSGNLLEFNPGYQEMLGYSDEELHHLSYRDLTPEKWHEIEAQIIEKQVVPNGQSQVFEKEYIRKDGTVFPVELRIFLLRDDDGQPEAMWAITRDITERKRNEEELKIFFDLIPELVCVASTEGHFLKINRMWQEVLGYTEAEILTTPFLELIHPDDRDATMKEVKRQVAGLTTMHFINRYRCKDGSYKWLEWGAAPALDGKLLFAAARDITEQKAILAELEAHRHHLEGLVEDRTRQLASLVETLKARELTMELQQRFLKTVTDAVPGMLGYWNDELRCIYANNAYQEWFAKQPDEMIGMHARDLLGEEIFHQNEIYIQAALRGEPQHFDRSLVKADGTICHVLIHYIPDVHDGKTRGFLVLATDISELKQAQVELERINAELKKRAFEAETANRAKSVFLANMSHELRTPLNAILGFSDILHRDPGATEDQKEALAIIHKSGDHLLGIINDVLDIAKIEAGRAMLQQAPFDLGGLILDVTGMLRLRAQEKSLQLRVEQAAAFPRYIVGDEAKLRQILINLITNALKATEEGGVILRLGLKHNHAEHLLIEVEDSGCGISPEDQTRVLEPFVQIGTQNKQQGTGLGLAITRQFVELMGGSLSLTSAVGQGSTFRVDIPIQMAQPEEIPETPKARGAVTGLAPGQPACRVLVAEDQWENQLFLQRLLEKAGFYVWLVDNGAETVEQFQSWRPHFIWMDRRMPVMDGEEAMRRIRALRGGGAVKIAVVTASSFREDNEELMAGGFDAIVHKPFQPEQIFECMERLLGLRFLRAPVEPEASPLPELAESAMAALPDSLRQALVEALVMLDRERILEVIEAIVHVDPELGAALNARIQRYDYKPVLVLLQGALSSTGEGETEVPGGG